MSNFAHMSVFFAKEINMDELETVQMLLRAIGSSPVNNLESTHPDVANARACIDRVRKSVQKRGWWFNQDYNTVFQADAGGVVNIPKEITKFVSDKVQYVKRGRKVYDAHEQTFVLNTDVCAIKTVRSLDWEDMPASIQEYAGYLACAQFVSDEIEDPNKQQKFEQLAGLAKLDVDAEDLDSARVNVFNNNRIARARGGVLPYSAGNNLRPNSYS